MLYILGSDLRYLESGYGVHCFLFHEPMALVVLCHHSLMRVSQLDISPEEADGVPGFRPAGGHNSYFAKIGK